MPSDIEEILVDALAKLETDLVPRILALERAASIALSSRITKRCITSVNIRCNVVSLTVAIGTFSALNRDKIGR